MNILQGGNFVPESHATHREEVPGSLSLGPQPPCLPSFLYIIDKKYVNKKERERRLLGYCQQASLEQTDHDENRSNIVAFSQHCGLLQLMKVTVLPESY